MVELFANSGAPDQMSHSVASNLGLHCFQLPFYRFPVFNGLSASVKAIFMCNRRFHGIIILKLVRKNKFNILL